MPPCKHVALVAAVICTALFAHNVAAVTAGGAMPNRAASNNRRLLQATAPPGGACGPSAGAVCGGGQCCSQWGYCGTTSGHCGNGCQARWGACSGTSAPTPPAATPPPATPPPATPPPATPPPTNGGSGGCVDTYAACPGWGAASCIYTGVPQLCPCMCGSKPPAVNPTPQPPAVNPTPQPPASAPPTAPPSGPSDSAAGVTKDQFTKVFAGDSDKCGSGCPGFVQDPNNAAVIDKHWGLFKSAAAATGFRLQNTDEASIFFGTIKHEYGGNLDQMKEFCGRRGEACPGGYGQYFGRGPLQLTWDYNYKAMGGKLGLDLLGNPDQVADGNNNVGWRSAMVFWTNSDFNCAGTWSAEQQALPTCPVAASGGNLAAVTKRINPLECAGGPYAASQPARVAKVQEVRSAWGLPALTTTTC